MMKNMQTRQKFGDARSLAQSLADSDQIKYGVLTTHGNNYMICSEHNPFYKLAESLDRGSMVFKAIPGASKEEVFRNALEQIAYPENWPTGTSTDLAQINRDLKRWMQSVAAKALTDSVTSS